jgi:hypothetical protein
MTLRKKRFCEKIAINTLAQVGARVGRITDSQSSPQHGLCQVAVIALSRVINRPIYQVSILDASLCHRTTPFRQAPRFGKCGIRDAIRACRPHMSESPIGQAAGVCHVIMRIDCSGTCDSQPPPLFRPPVLRCTTVYCRTISRSRQRHIGRFYMNEQYQRLRLVTTYHYRYLSRDRPTDMGQPMPL